MIVSRQACASGVDDCTVVDLEAHLPYDMRAETAIAPSPLAGEGWDGGGGRLRTEHVRLRRGVVYGRS